MGPPIARDGTPLAGPARDWQKLPDGAFPGGPCSVPVDGSNTPCRFLLRPQGFPPFRTHWERGSGPGAGPPAQTAATCRESWVALLKPDFASSMDS